MKGIFEPHETWSETTAEFFKLKKNHSIESINFCLKFSLVSSFGKIEYKLFDLVQSKKWCFEQENRLEPPKEWILVADSAIISCAHFASISPTRSLYTSKDSQKKNPTPRHTYKLRTIITTLNHSTHTTHNYLTKCKPKPFEDHFEICVKRVGSTVHNILTSNWMHKLLYNIPSVTRIRKFWLFVFLIENSLIDTTLFPYFVGLSHLFYYFRGHTLSWHS